MTLDEWMAKHDSLLRQLDSLMEGLGSVIDAEVEAGIAADSTADVTADTIADITDGSAENVLSAR